jgi:hypothetical protein
VEAAGVNCTTTTECTATTPEFSREWSNPVDVTATVNNVASPQTPADQFTYHGLYLVGEDGSPFRVGETVVLRGIVKATETEDCFAFVEGTIASNGQTTDEIDIRPAEFEACEQEHFFADLPFSFVLRLSDEGSATIVGPMGVRTGFSNGCVYESDHISGTFETEGPLDFRLNATFPLVAEEEPGCNATEQVALDVFTDKGYAVELIG